MRAEGKRRRLAIILLVLACLVYGWLDYSLTTHFFSTSKISGLILFCLVLGLAAFNSRKKLPFLPLLRASTWMQWHIYVGFFAMLVFVFHIQWKLPHGMLEVLVAILFLLVALSGIVGLVLTRSLPTRITNSGEQVVYERIPGVRNELRREVERLVIESEGRTQSSTIADFYEAQLSEFFARPRHFWSHLFGSRKPLNQMRERIKALERYLNKEEIKLMKEITAQVVVKDGLDTQWYLQGILKAWLFVHIPLSAALLLFAVVHGLLAWRFS